MKAVTIKHWVLFLDLVLLCHWVKGACPSPEFQSKLDPGSKAYLAPVVFQGSLLSVNKTNEGLMLTYRVQKIHKVPDNQKLEGNKEVHVIYHYRSKMTAGRNRSRSAGGKRPTVARLSSTCQLHLQDRELKTDHRYIVYGIRLSRSALAAVFTPVIHNKKSSRAVRKVLCRQCAKKAEVHGLSEDKKDSKKRLQIKCKVTGIPKPWVDWYRDGKKLKSNDRIRIRRKKKQSLLTIKKPVVSDSGRYECRASNVVNKKPVSLFAAVTVVEDDDSPFTDPTTTSHYQGEKCESTQTNYCVNGGTCRFYPSIGEMSCHCAEGYKGKRCENKDISPVGVVQRTVDLDETTRMLQMYWGK